MAKRIAICLSATLLLGACSSAPVSGIPASRVRGSGQPTMVFQSGLGDGAAVWDTVQREVAGRATTVAFDRPGYGKSPSRAEPRSPCQAADEQRELLRSLGLKPPYVLVGHSLGGLYQYVYAKRYPDEVAGLVLLDPTYPEHWQRVQEGAPIVAGVVKVARLRFSPIMRKEFDDQAACLDQVDWARPTGVPARLLVRGSFSGLDSGAFERVARRSEGDWARLLSIESAERVPGSGHYLQRDRPAAVVDAITSLIRQ